MGDAVSVEQLAKDVQANCDKAEQDVVYLRQEIAEDRAETAQKLDKLEALVMELIGRSSGPTDSAGIASALETPAKQDAAIKSYGAQWLLSVQSEIPGTVWAQPDFPSKFAKATALLVSTSGMLEPPVSPSIGKATSGLGSVVPPVGPTLTSSGTVLPFSAAIAGRHVKIELPRPRRFTKIAADSDINAWLLRVQEYLTVSGIDPTCWVVFASNFLDNVPLQLWEARKMQHYAHPELLYSWDSFKQWCLDSFSIRNAERHALRQLEDLRQTGSVVEYKAAHNMLASKTSLPMQLRIYWWERGLKSEIADQVKVDPLTYKGYTDIDKAQSAACAYGARYDPVLTTTSRKRTRSPSPSDTDSESPDSDTRI